MTIRVLISVACLGLAGIAAADEYRLVGTIVLSPDADRPSHAVFETPDGRQLIVDKGQHIGGCRLAAVSERTAVMDCADGSVSVALRSDLHVPSIEPARRTAEYQVTLPRDAFLVAVSDRQRMASQMSLEPAVRDGMFRGYRVAWLDPDGDFRRLGLRPEDVIVSLNDVPAATPGAFMQAVNGLRGQTSFHLAVERSGELIGFSYLLD